MYPLFYVNSCTSVIYYMYRKVTYSKREVQQMKLDTIGRYVREYRLAKGITQEQLAEMVDISPSYVSMIERSEKIPALETLIDLANALGVSTDMLLCEALKTELQIKRNVMLDNIAKLPKREQERIFAVVDTMIQQAKKK